MNPKIIFVTTEKSENILRERGKITDSYEKSREMPALERAANRRRLEGGGCTERGRKSMKGLGFFVFVLLLLSFFFSFLFFFFFFSLSFYNKCVWKFKPRPKDNY